MPKIILSYLLGICLGLLITAPAINYTIPMVVNTSGWLYTVMASGLLGILLVLTQKMHWSLKVLVVYLFINCFLSQVPYLGFNAYILVVATAYFYLLIQNARFKPVFEVIEAAFLLEIVLTCFQLLGKDRLLNFDRPEPVFMGTVMQYMRFSSLLAVIAPFLLIKNKLYLIPIVIFCIISRSSTFAISLVVGGLVYFVLSDLSRIKKLLAMALAVIFGVFYAIYDWGSFRGAIIPSNGGRLISWVNVVQTWLMDTRQDNTFPMLEGPFHWDWFLFGHGMDTFLPLFPIFKHDANPFPQAHNDWLQLLWEIGIVGALLIVIYCVNLVMRLYRARYYKLIAGLASMGTNMFFAFPTRMTQTALLIVTYLAFCEQRLKRSI